MLYVQYREAAPFHVLDFVSGFCVVEHLKHYAISVLSSFTHTLCQHTFIHKLSLCESILINTIKVVFVRTYLNFLIHTNFVSTYSTHTHPIWTNLLLLTQSVYMYSTSIHTHTQSLCKCTCLYTHTCSLCINILFPLNSMPKNANKLVDPEQLQTPVFHHTI